MADEPPTRSILQRRLLAEASHFQEADIVDFRKFYDNRTLAE